MCSPLAGRCRRVRVRPAGALPPRAHRTCRPTERRRLADRAGRIDAASASVQPSISARASSAPRARLSPRSPSPTLWSSLRPPLLRHPPPGRLPERIDDLRAVARPHRKGGARGRGDDGRRPAHRPRSAPRPGGGGGRRVEKAQRPRVGPQERERTSSGSRRTPASPWMPSPSSISTSPSAKPGLPAAGTVRADSGTPIEPGPAMAFSAAAPTSDSDAPSAAMAPDTLWTGTVPAIPHRPAFSMAAARPKLRRSPV